MITPAYIGEPIGYKPVADFYAGKSVFLTGITGFLGKVFLEKLLYSCRDINNVYVLIRNKKGADAQQRLQEIFQKPMFSRLKAERQHEFTKVIPITGDIAEPNLGISAADEETILNKVSVVFHGAASIRFNESVKDIVNTNVLGTKYLLDLCQRMKNIQVFVYISTAFSHPYLKVLEDKVYPPLKELDTVLNFLDKPHQESEVQELIKDHPNSYTFSKEFAEECVVQHHGSIPVVIIRPSIVTSSMTEPIPGWIDCWSGATGLIMAINKGATRVLPGNGRSKLDLIPVDYVINTSIVAAARCKTSGVTVYNCCTSSCKPITVKEVSDFAELLKPFSTTGCNKNTPSVTFTNSKIKLNLLTFLRQTTPAFAGDMILRIKGQQPRYMKMQSKLLTVRSVLTDFLTTYREMRADRVITLYASLSPEDRRNFPCNPLNINWAEYFSVYLEGIERFMINKSKI